MNRIKELRKQNNLSQGKLAKLLKIHQTAVSQWETGRTSPEKKLANKMAGMFGVSIGYILGYNENVYGFGNIIPIEKNKIPLLGEIACGEPLLAEEYFEGYVESGTDIRADFALRCKGDSMINARIQDGDIVFIRKQPDVDNGEIAAVIIEDEATLKRVYKEDGRVILMAENQKFKPLVYSGSELEQISIIGKAIAFQSNVM
ncbi:MAG: helix-turn-helix domain-containing protein [Oscillospiraceae bacterium]|nr:helix-turn-helix domain-containing protein [Oscillospiraceae bacterium]